MGGLKVKTVFPWCHFLALGEGVVVVQVPRSSGRWQPNKVFVVLLQADTIITVAHNFTNCQGSPDVVFVKFEELLQVCTGRRHPWVVLFHLGRLLGVAARLYQTTSTEATMERQR